MAKRIGQLRTAGEMVNNLVQQNEQLREQLETARAVAAYARHSSDCKPVDNGPCDCGLNQALANANPDKSR